MTQVFKKKHTKSRRHALSLTALLLVASISLWGHAENQLPTIGNSSSKLISIDEEKKLGQYWLRSLRSQVELYHNPIVHEYFTHLVYSLAPSSGVEDSDFSLVIVNSPALNAFAVPGSVMGINAGLFLYASNEQEFAAVIAHELAHLSQRHYARRLEAQNRSQPLQLAGLLASVVVMATAGTEAGVAALASTQAMGIENQLSFSRENEQEADRLGVRILNESNFDPRAMPSMFERMYRQNRLQGQKIPEYLSTHPLSENRVADTRNRANQFPVKRYLDNPEYHFSKSIVLADFAENEKKAIDYLSQFVNGDSSIQSHAARFGTAYLLMKDKPEEALALIARLERSFPDQLSIQNLKAQALHYQGKTNTAIALLETQLKRYPDNYPTAMVLSDILMKAGQLDRSAHLLTNLSRNQANNAKVWELLAEVQGLAGNIAQLHLARAEYFQLKGNFKLAREQLALAKSKSRSNPTLSARIHARTEEIGRLENSAPF